MGSADMEGAVTLGLPHDSVSRNSMRPAIRLLASLVTLLTGIGACAAQTAPPSPFAFESGDVDGAITRSTDPPEGRWHADLLLGLPTGLRVQATLGDDGRQAWVGEVFAGLELIFPAIGAGARYRFTPIKEGCDTFRISPGVDVYGVFWPSSGDTYLGWSAGSAILFTADVDFAWEHSWGERLGSELGLKVGLGVAVHENDTVPVPVLSLYGGLKF